MRIAVDESISGAAEVFGKLGEITLFPGRQLKNRDLSQIDAVVVRSVTPVGSDLLDNTPVKFVGTATSGTDHVDQPYLKSRGIRFVDAAGCNSRAVAEYVVAALVLTADRENRPLAGRILGIIGCGRIGCIVSRLCHTLGMTILINDPPLARDGRIDGHIELDPLLAQCDFVTLHVPLTFADGGFARDFPTQNMVNSAWLAKMKPGAAIINAARGEIIDKGAMLVALQAKRIRAIFDVWPKEPDIDAELAGRADIATPHLAGYSLQSKRRATAMIARALADWMGKTSKIAGFLDVFESATSVTLSPSPISGASSSIALADILARVCPLAEIDRDVRGAIGNGRIAQEFDRIRAAHAGRSEWSSLAVGRAAAETHPVLTALGFQVE